MPGRHLPFTHLRENARVPISPLLLRADEAPEPRTLVDIFRATVAAHPDTLALDNGREKRFLVRSEMCEVKPGLGGVSDR